MSKIKNIQDSSEEKNCKLNRRRFIQTGSALMAIPFIATESIFAQAIAADQFPSDENVRTAIADAVERVVSTCSTFDCGGKCHIRAHLKDGVLTQITSRLDDELNEAMPVMRACVRGRAYRKFVYHPDRLKYPMKRVGKRGEGKFERITWDEATTLIADHMKRTAEQYGAASRFISVSTGDSSGAFTGTGMLKRLLNLTGGHLPYYHSVSMGNTAAITPYTYGTAATGSTLDTLEDTKLVILWGHNPNESIFGHTNHYYQKMKSNGTKFIVVDPRYSDTAASLADQWIPLKPTTDNAVMDAMMYVIFTENLHDSDFIKRCTIGFDEQNMPQGVAENESLVAYLTGRKDGVQKTPEWAEKISGVPAQTITQLAREYATTKPAALIQGWGPQRHECGERVARGATLLATITGNVGVKGGWASGYGGIGSRLGINGPDELENPVKANICVTSWVDAIEDASQITPEKHGLKGVDRLDSNIRMIFSMAGNYLTNQNTNILRAAKVLEDESKVEFIVYNDLYMTPSAKYADLLLPDVSFLECWNIGGTWGSGNYFMLSEKLIEPEFERRPSYAWLTDVAEKLGVKEAFTEGRSNEEWIAYLLERARENMPQENIPTLDELRVKRIHYFNSEPHVAFARNVADPQRHPFNTPSGKIEIFSKRLYDMKNPGIPALSHYVPATEGPEDTLTAKYPLQLITWKGRNRANSTQFANPWLQEVQQQELWINPIDAQHRELEQGDKVKIYNDRGITMIPVKITPRIMPGVVALQAGAWWAPDQNGVDIGGCANVLTSDRTTPLAKGNTHQTLLVEVNKV